MTSLSNSPILIAVEDLEHDGGGAVDVAGVKGCAATNAGNVVRLRHAEAVIAISSAGSVVDART